jgi:hypothetical protein
MRQNNQRMRHLRLVLYRQSLMRNDAIDKAAPSRAGLKGNCSDNDNCGGTVCDVCNTIDAGRSADAALRMVGSVGLGHR